MPAENTVLPRENLAAVAEIMQRAHDSLDEAALKTEKEINDLIRELRKVHSPLANEIEYALSVARSRAMFGTGSSSYLKTEVLGTLVKKHFGDNV
jgi:hypothetical protein